PAPRSFNSPRLRSKTVTSQPARPNAIAAAHPAMLPPTTAMRVPSTLKAGSLCGRLTVLARSANLRAPATQERGQPDDGGRRWVGIALPPKSCIGNERLSLERVEEGARP